MTTEPRRNTLAILGLSAFLDQNPAKLNQRQWAIVPEAEFARDHKDLRFTCGTVACVAGWTSLLSGDRVREAAADLWEHNDDGQPTYRVGSVTTPDGRIMPIANRAMEVLGLGYLTASALFHVNNEGFVVREALRRLANGDDDAAVREFLSLHNSRIDINPTVM